MANYSAIKAAVNGYIKANGRKEITGSILNAVLNATIESLGRFFQFAGGAMPTDDPGTPDQNVCYLATEPGLYIHFNNIRINNEEVALLFWNGEWVKQTIAIGIQEVEASVDNNSGTPSVDVSYSQGRLVLTFHNLKGDKGNTGDPAGFGTIGADITGGVGTPGVSVETSGDNAAKNILFHFTNLKGETGVTSVVATIDDTSGTPSCRVSLVNGQLTLAFSGLKGLKGDTGVSADYPITIYNGLDSDATDQALAAAQGKVMDGKIGVLNGKVSDILADYTEEVFDSPNLFDKTAVTTGKGVRKDLGTLYTDANFCASDYIPIPDGAASLYCSPAQSYGGVIGWAFYNASKVFTHGGASHTPGVREGDAYFRFSVRATLLDTTMLIAGTSADLPDHYVPYGDEDTWIRNPIDTDDLADGAVESDKIANGAVTTDKLANGSVTEEKLSSGVLAPIRTRVSAIEEFLQPESKVTRSSNLLDLSACQHGYIDNRDGTFHAITPGGAHDNYFATDFIPVSENGLYCSCCAVYGTVGKGAVYDANKGFLRALNSGVYEYVAGDGFVRWTISNTYTYKQINEGTTLGPIEPYFPPIITDYIGNEDFRVKGEQIEGLGRSRFSCLASSGSIAPGESVTTPLVHIAKGMFITAEILGSIQSVEVGVARLGSYGRWVVITPSSIIVKYGQGETTYATYQHGLTLGTRTRIMIERTSRATAQIRLFNDSGEVFTQENVVWVVNIGKAFVYNGNASGNVDASVCFMPKDIDKKIWVFGDSYCSLSDPARWPYYMVGWGYENFLLDARPGRDADAAISELRTLLETGAKPSYLVWCLGMNRADDIDESVNPTWLGITDELIEICDMYGIELVLQTIPSVPNHIHYALTDWIRNSGYRYIDVAEAVEVDGTDTWLGWGTADALLSSDEVHPTQKGAVVIASKILQDFPEIAIAD